MSESKNLSKIIPAVFIILLVGIGAFFALKTKSGVGSVVPNADFTKGLTEKYKVYESAFSLTHPKHLIGLSRDSLPWGGQIQLDDEKSGHVVTFCAKGKRPALKDPYVQVYYVNRQNPSFSVKDSALQLIEKNIFLVQESKMLSKRKMIKTQGGREAIACEYLWGKRPMYDKYINEKYVAYAYLEHSDKFLLAFTLTTTEKEMFDNYLPDFYYIIQSYK